MGQPEMEALWQDLSTRKQAGRLGKDEEKFFKKLVKVLGKGRFGVVRPPTPGLSWVCLGTDKVGSCVVEIVYERPSK
jgi:hypothetical protein